MNSTAAGVTETQIAAAAIDAEDRDGNHAAIALQNGGYESERRAQRRQRHELEKEEAKQWEIVKSLSDISAEVELLTQEVCEGLPCCLTQLPVISSRDPATSRPCLDPSVLDPSSHTIP